MSDLLQPRQRGLKAAQIRNAPDFPVQNLYPCAQGPEPYVYWLLGAFNLSEGILVQTDGWISFAPVMVARMEIKRFRVIVNIDAFDETCEYKLRILYRAKTDEIYEQYSESLRATDIDTFAFDIPLEHVARTGSFTFVLHVDLLTPLSDGDDRDRARESGLEEPRMPVLIRGAHLEIKG